MYQAQTPGGAVRGLAPWKDMAGRPQLCHNMWDPENNPHHSIIGLTGSGKSYLVLKAS